MTKFKIHIICNRKKQSLFYSLKSEDLNDTNLHQLDTKTTMENALDEALIKIGEKIKSTFPSFEEIDGKIYQRV